MLELGTRVKVISGKYEGAILSIIGVWRIGGETNILYTLHDRDTNIFIDNIGERNVEVVSESLQANQGGFEI